MLRRILFSLAALGAAWAGGIEYLRSRPALATAWCPWDPELWMDRAASEPNHARAWLDRAAALETYHAPARIQRAAWAEQALAADRRFASHWALLNFAFRQDDAPLFWRIAPHALRMSHRDRTPLFELLWRRQPDGPWLASHLLPPHPPILLQFSRFLSQKGDLATARAVFLRLLHLPYLSPAHANAGPIASTEERRDLGLVLCDLSWDHGEPAAAVETWNALVEHRLLPYQRAGNALPPLQNPRFDFPALRQGFDWRPLPVPGAVLDLEPGGRFRWDGFPPGNQPVLSQHLALTPGRHYRFRFHCSGAPSGSWRWEVLPPRSNTPLATTSLGTCQSQGSYLDLLFPAGPDGFLRLRLLATAQDSASHFTLADFQLDPVNP
jgi:hypothetical protein